MSMRDATISRSKRLKEPPRIGFARRLRRAAERLLRERRLACDIGHRIAECGPVRVAEGRRRDADVRGRRPEAEIVGDGNERGQIGKIGAAHC